MKKSRIVVLDTGYESFAHEKQLLTEAGYTFEVFPGRRDDLSGKMAFAGDAVGVFLRWTVADVAFFQALPSLKVLVRYGVGYDNVDIAAATRHGVAVANVQGYANDSVSDHALALIYACGRGLLMGHRELYGTYGNPPFKSMPEFRSCTLGIIGLGRIGGRLCEKARPIFDKVLACDPYISDARFRALGAVKADLDAILAQSHVISIHCNLTPETTRMIDRRALAKIRQKPILVNTARGPVVDENDLLSALQRGLVRSAGLDVYWTEPPEGAGAELAAHPAVIATGHYAWYSDQAHVELQKRAADNMLALLSGHLADDCLNPAQRSS